ncbi:MAG: ABC transporter ATP-binding protein [Eubacteriales bacterium]|jgi:ATP-binding cassette subfamily B protein|nr:ABC transporter ATP-binding protein [Eubacteriales bacterium]MDD4135070.1 ABC transporter ATP-binding protein [Eubacteriales bacterium]NLO13628.1 ABC transporter ATP-binding protein [Clostridiales bacterium]
MSEFYAEEQAPDRKLNFSIWFRLLKDARSQWKRLGFIAVMMGVLAIVDIVVPLMTRFVIDRYVLPKDTSGLWLFVLVYLAMIAMQTYAVYKFIDQAGRVEFSIAYDMRTRGFRKLQELPFSYYDRMPVGYLMSRMTSDISHLADAIGWSLVDIAYALIFLIIATVVMLVINWQLALGVLAIVPPIILVTIFFQKRILKAQREVRKMNAQITGAFNEGIMGAKTTKSLVREEENFKEFSELTGGMRRASVRSATLSSLFLPIVLAISSLASAFALAYGSNQVLKGALSLGTVTAFVSYSVMFFHPIRDIAYIFGEMQRMQAAAERVIGLLETAPDIQDTPDVEEKYGDNFHPKRENWEELNGEITFEHVTFRYKDGEQVLEDFNLHVKPGETLALVGPTGAGKSTIVNLICRFYEPTEGRILIDGVDYRERSQLWLQSNLGYVLQEPRLFSGTVLDNIRYADPQAPEEQAHAAARMVDAERFILKLEKGYDTPVGEGGSRLSTGEKQLVSFARAILHNPRLFVLDEATSSVDTETEQDIQHAIERTLSGRTSFIIAHRLSTIRSADRILFIDDGRIREEGTHRELMRKKGLYYELYTNQFQEEASRDLLKVKAAP